MLEQPLDRAQLEDPLRLGRRDDAPPRLAVLLEHPRFVGGQPIRVRLRIDGPDEFRRVLEGRVGGIDFDHREHRRHRPLERQDVAELLLDHVTDHPFGLRAEHVERIGLDLLIRCALQREQADLRPVAVPHDELMLHRDGRERFRGGSDVEPLVLRRHRLAAAEQCVAAERCYHEHDQSPSVATRMALMVCMRFSACSNAML